MVSENIEFRGKFMGTFVAKTAYFDFGMPGPQKAKCVDIVIIK